MKKLGKTQASVLWTLCDHKRWWDGCGWIWGNNSTTVRLLESLVKRGLAKNSMKNLGGPKPCLVYEATDAGYELAGVKRRDAVA